jgi:hypothetical protein
LEREILVIWWLKIMVFFFLDEQLIGEESGGYLYPHQNLTVASQESPAKAGVKSG